MIQQQHMLSNNNSNSGTGLKYKIFVIDYYHAMKNPDQILNQKTKQVE